jgi:hypothetical protein
MLALARVRDDRGVRWNTRRGVWRIAAVSPRRCSAFAITLQLRFDHGQPVQANGG